MGGANGSRERTPDDKLSDTINCSLWTAMGFAKGSTHPTYFQQPQDPLRAGVVEMMQSEHGVSSAVLV